MVLVHPYGFVSANLVIEHGDLYIFRPIYVVFNLGLIFYAKTNEKSYEIR